MKNEDETVAAWRNEEDETVAAVFRVFYENSSCGFKGIWTLKGGFF